MKLKSIIKAAGWTQEQLAQALGVTFATLNSWVNERSRPRKQALLKIEKLYLNIVGVDDVAARALNEAKLTAVNLKITPKSIVKNEKVLDRLTLYLTYHTNTIEGSTMTLVDVREVIFEHKVLSNRTAIEQVEARNHQATLFWLLEQLSAGSKKFVINENLILGIHLRLMNGLVSDAGQYRKHTVRIMGSKVVLANWVKVPELIRQILLEINNPSGDIIRDLARVHAKFEQTHPFGDGNGRTGRLLLLAQALNSGFAPPLVVKERKFAYYKYLELAQTQDNYDPLELFVAESMQFSHKLLKEK